MSLAIAVYIPQPSLIWLSHESKRLVMDHAVLQCWGPMSSNSPPQSFRDATPTLGQFQLATLFNGHSCTETMTDGRLDELFLNHTRFNTTECTTLFFSIHTSRHYLQSHNWSNIFEQCVPYVDSRQASKAIKCLKVSNNDKSLHRHYRKSGRRETDEKASLEMAAK